VVLTALSYRFLERPFLRPRTQALATARRLVRGPAAPADEQYSR